jgi:hypothetical protein
MLGHFKIIVQSDAMPIQHFLEEVSPGELPKQFFYDMWLIRKPFFQMIANFDEREHAMTKVGRQIRDGSTEEISRLAVMSRVVGL